jgi:uncharacterized BrkB/YihY/UPF0761 family membrane protein
MTGIRNRHQFSICIGVAFYSHFSLFSQLLGEFARTSFFVTCGEYLERLIHELKERGV